MITLVVTLNLYFYISDRYKVRLTEQKRQEEETSEDSILEKTVIGMTLDDFEKIYGYPVITTTNEKIDLQYIKDSWQSPIDNVNDINELINKYYVMDKYIVRGVFDNDRLVAYFISIRKRGDLLSESMPEVQAIGRLGEDTYDIFRGGANYPIAYYANVPASNNELMYYGELYSPVPRIYHYIMVCSIDFGFIEDNVDKNEICTRHKLAYLFGWSDIPYALYRFKNPSSASALDNWIEYRKATDTDRSVDQMLLSDLGDYRAQCLPNTVGIIKEGYEYHILPIDNSLELSMFSVIKKY